jgi:hypothetical protein
MQGTQGTTAISQEQVAQNHWFVLTVLLFLNMASMTAGWQYQLCPSLFRSGILMPSYLLSALFLLRRALSFAALSDCINSGVNPRGFGFWLQHCPSVVTAPLVHFRSSS